MTLQDPEVVSYSEEDLESEPALGAFKTTEEAQLQEEDLKAKFAAAAAAAADVDDDATAAQT